jgi:hypothetical protein
MALVNEGGGLLGLRSLLLEIVRTVVSIHEVPNLQGSVIVGLILALGSALRLVVRMGKVVGLVRDAVGLIAQVAFLFDLILFSSGRGIAELSSFMLELRVVSQRSLLLLAWEQLLGSG